MSFETSAALNVLSVHAGSDTGGQAIRMTRGFARHAPSWTFRSITRPAAFNYIAYPMDLAWRKRTVAEHWQQADVVHLHNNFNTAAMLERRLGTKPSVVHFHGTHYRADWRNLNRQQRQRRAVGLCSTLDLWLLAPDDTIWLPAPYDINWLQSLRRQQRPSATAGSKTIGSVDRQGATIRIAHAPTARTIKSTEHFVTAMERLQADYPVEVDVIERVSWAECLRRKARADIFFDQTILGYGCNALEAWGMGIPVVAGGADETLDEMERRFGGLPFYHATESTIYEALRELLESPKLRQRYGRIGHDYVREWHDEAKVVERLKGIYHRALGQSMEEAA